MEVGGAGRLESRKKERFVGEGLERERVLGLRRRDLGREYEKLEVRVLGACGGRGVSGVVVGFSRGVAVAFGKGEAILDVGAYLRSGFL